MRLCDSFLLWITTAWGLERPSSAARVMSYALEGGCSATPVLGGGWGRGEPNPICGGSEYKMYANLCYWNPLITNLSRPIQRKNGLLEKNKETSKTLQYEPPRSPPYNSLLWIPQTESVTVKGDDCYKPTPRSWILNSNCRESPEVCKGVWNPEEVKDFVRQDETNFHPQVDVIFSSFPGLKSALSHKSSYAQTVAMSFCIFPIIPAGPFTVENPPLQTAG